MNVHVTPTLPMLIDGKLVSSNKTYDVENPSTGEPFTQCPDCSREQLDEAVAAANRAFPGWSQTSYEDRKKALVALSDRIKENADALAELITLEVGKPLDKAKSEVAGSVFWLKSFADVELPVEVLRDTPDQRVELHRKPLGVVGAILPWNYPVLTAVWKIAPAIITGNTLVMKPSPLTPVATLKIGEIAQDVFPPGVLNIVSGGNDLGAWITEHPEIRKISFTGSAATGKKVMESSASNLKRLTLELGGNDAGLILDDVDPKKIANNVFWSRFANNGQVCVALKRLYVPEELHDPMVEALADVAKDVKVGDGFEEGNEVGPVQNKMQYEKVKEIFDDAVSKGAEVFYQGEIPEGSGYFFPITILTNVKPGMKILEEEAFGPLLPVMSYSDLDEAIERVNGTEYGLGGSVWSDDPDRAMEIAQRFESGSAWVNQHPAMGPDIPFGGVKQSGMGVECGRWGVEEYTSIRVINVNKKKAA